MNKLNCFNLFVTEIINFEFYICRDFSEKFLKILKYRFICYLIDERVHIYPYFWVRHHIYYQSNT